MPLISDRKIVVALLAPTGQIQPRGSVVDGDTLELMDAKRIRLWGIDAPEGAQTCQRAGRPWRCGDDATRALELLIHGREMNLHRAIGVRRANDTLICVSFSIQVQVASAKRLSRRFLCSARTSPG
jgi:endonuclease YncB( thermonuclease family)